MRSSLLAQHRNTFPKKTFQWRKAIEIRSWFYSCSKCRVGSTFCRGAFRCPSSRPQQPRTCCKTNMHLKHIGPKKHMPLLAQHHNAFPKQCRRTNMHLKHWAKAIQTGFWFLQVLTFKCRAGSTFCKGTFHPPSCRPQTPAAQRTSQNKHSPEGDLNNKKICTTPQAKHHDAFPWSSLMLQLRGFRLFPPKFTAGACFATCFALLGSGAGRVEGVCANWGILL